jgi:hypothetical protein
VVARGDSRGGQTPFVFAYHEIIRSPENGIAEFDPRRCDVYYRGELSPDFYAWVFPHGATTSVGVGSAHKGFSLRGAVADLRRAARLEGLATVRREGAPIPLRPLKKWDNGRDVVLAGDAAGVVAPASGEGIYYAMETGRLAAEAVVHASGQATREASPPPGSSSRWPGRVFDPRQRAFWYRGGRRGASSACATRTSSAPRPTPRGTRADIRPPTRIFFGHGPLLASSRLAEPARWNSSSGERQHHRFRHGGGGGDFAPAAGGSCRAAAGWRPSQHRRGRSPPPARPDRPGRSPVDRTARCSTSRFATRYACRATAPYLTAFTLRGGRWQRKRAAIFTRRAPLGGDPIARRRFTPDMDEEWKH